MIDRKQTTGRIKVMSVFGTRPEATKMAPLILSLQQDPQIESIVTVTAQHRELLDPVLSLFQIHPDYDLNIMRRSQTLTSIAVRALEGWNRFMQRQNRIWFWFTATPPLRSSVPFPPITQKSRSGMSKPVSALMINTHLFRKR